MAAPGKTTVFKQLISNIIFPLIIALILLAYFNYTRNRDLLLSAHQEKNERIQNEIRNILAFQDLSLEPVERDMDKYLTTMSDILVNEFFRETDSIEFISLEDIRRKLGMKQDIYIINRQGIIVNTTFVRDLNFNLFSIDEKHKEFLLSIFENGQFISEKLSLERSTRRLKKYTYQPTKDGKYIIEIGSYSSEANRIVDLYRSHLEKLSNLAPSIVSVDLFLGGEDPASFIRDAQIDPEYMDLYHEAFSEQTRINFKLEGAGKRIWCEFIYMDRENTDLYEGSIIRIITDRSGEEKLIFQELQQLMLIFGLALLILSVLVYKRAQAITSPIQHLAESAKQIERGDIDVRAQVEGRNEITSLAEHFNSMMERLANYYNELEQKVAERTAEVVAQKEEIERQKISLTDSIVYAKRIQNAMLPSSHQMEQALDDHFVIFWPKDIVSGDFYWLSQKGDKVFVTAVDCTGHGVPGAFMSMIGSSLLNKIVNENGIHQPAEVLNNMREGVFKSLNKEGQEESTNDGMDMSFVSLDMKNMELEFAGANNPLYIIRNGEMIIFKGDKQPVGAFIKEFKPFTNNTVTLEKGDMVYVFSDGFQDQFGGENKTKFMVGKFKKFLIEIGHLSTAEQKERITKAYQDWKGNLSQVDDIVIIGIRI
ncbi:MAG: SpoIIE family protein phosphatase [Vicingaceae bacterium]